MTKKEKDALRFDFQKYKRDFNKKMKKGQIREGVELLNFEEYSAMRSEYMPYYTSLVSAGNDVSINELILSDSSKIEEPALKAVQKLLLQTEGRKVGLEVIRDKSAHYFEILRNKYPDDESYDMAISSNFEW